MLGAGGTFLEHSITAMVLSTEKLGQLGRTSSSSLLAFIYSECWEHKFLLAGMLEKTE